MKETIDLSEERILKMRLVSSQMNLINVSLENIELKKQLLLSDKKAMEENYKELIKEINIENDINSDDYNIDFVQKKLVRKK